MRSLGLWKVGWMMLGGVFSAEAFQTVWKVGLSADYPPFEYRQDGQILGLDVDLAKALAEKIGVTVQFQDLDFGALIPALESGRIDVAISGLSASPERTQRLVFSPVYYRSRMALLFRKDSSWNEKEPLAKLGKIGVQMGTTLEKAVRLQKIQKEPRLEILALGKTPLLLQELKIRHLAGVLVEEAQATSFLKVHPFLKAIPWSPPVGMEAQEGYVLAFSRKKAVSEVQRWMDALKGFEAEGKLAALIQRWIPSSFSASPSPGPSR